MTLQSHRALPATPHIQVVKTHELASSQGGRAHIGFRKLPVGQQGQLDFEPLLLCAIDTLPAGETIGMHEHDNVDDILLLRRGTVRHRDSLGNESLLHAGDAYLLAAGESIRHSESSEGAEDVHAVVVWLRPDSKDGPSNYYQLEAGKTVERHGWSLIASGRPHAAGTALPLRSNAELVTANMAAGDTLNHEIGEGRRVYLAILQGAVSVNGSVLRDGERALIEGRGSLEFSPISAAEVMLVDATAP